MPTLCKKPRDRKRDRDDDDERASSQRTTRRVRREPELPITGNHPPPAPAPE